MIRTVVVLAMFYFMFFFGVNAKAQGNLVNWGVVMWVSDEYDYRITFDSVGPARLVVFFKNEDHDFIPLYQTARLVMGGMIIISGEEFRYWNLKGVLIRPTFVAMYFKHEINFEMIPIGKMHYHGLNGTLYYWPVIL